MFGLAQRYVISYTEMSWFYFESLLWHNHFNQRIDQYDHCFITTFDVNYFNHEYFESDLAWKGNWSDMHCVCASILRFTMKLSKYYTSYALIFKNVIYFMCRLKKHHNDVIMSAMVFQIISRTTVNSIVHSVTDQRKHQSSASLAFVRGIHLWPVNSPRKGPVTRKMLPFDGFIMK